MSTLDEHDEVFLQEALSEARDGEKVTLWVGDHDATTERLHQLCDDARVLRRITVESIDQAPGQ